jgi:leucyl-tRNA synthetase
MDDFAPDNSGQSPLARIPEFVHTNCPVCHGRATRETDTMGGFACSSWYFQRFTSPHYQEGPFDADQVGYWMPVDLYVGGAEHAVLHLLYARFWTKVLADAGLVSYREPFSKLLNQGQLMGPDGSRMSKSRGNVIVPDQIVATYGADALRIYVMFMAPFEQDVGWNTEGINGARRFLNRVWSLYANAGTLSTESETVDLEVEWLLHKTVRDVTERIETFRLNTMVSVLMEFVNALSKKFQEGKWRTRSYQQALETLLILLAPSAPHICEELWQLTGYRGSVHQQPWPSWDATILEQKVVEIPVQIDGKLRDRIVIPVEATRTEIEPQVFGLPYIQQYLSQREVVRIIFIPGKVFNIVTRAIGWKNINK